MTMRLLAPAQVELDEAVEWYNLQAPGLGDAFLVEVVRAARRIEVHPLAWPMMANGIRRCRLLRFPYALVYVPDGGNILVLAIAHLHRKPGYWRDRKDIS